MLLLVRPLYHCVPGEVRSPEAPRHPEVRGRAPHVAAADAHAARPARPKAAVPRWLWAARCAGSRPRTRTSPRSTGGLGARLCAP